MDKKTRDFFKEVIEKDGSPVFSGKMHKKDSEFWLASKLRSFWNFLIGNGKSKKHKTKATPVKETKQEEQKEPQQSTEEEKLIETFEKAHPDEAGRTKLGNTTPQ